MRIILLLQFIIYLACVVSSQQIEPSIVGEICAGPNETGATCTKLNTFNYNRATKTCDQVKIHTGPCGFFHIKLKCEVMCSVIKSTLIRKLDHLKHDGD